MEIEVKLSPKCKIDREAYEWLRDIVGKGEYFFYWEFLPNSVFFKKPEDALAFKLKFDS